TAHPAKQQESCGAAVHVVVPEQQDGQFIFQYAPDKLRRALPGFTGGDALTRMRIEEFLSFEMGKTQSELRAVRKQPARHAGQAVQPLGHPTFSASGCDACWSCAQGPDQSDG